MKHAITAIALAALLPLAACGGGGGGSGSVDQGSGGQPEPVTISSLTGMAAPAETVADQIARTDGIADSADHLSLTTIHGNTNHPSFPTFVMVVANCEDASCKVPEPDFLGGETQEFEPYGLHFFGSADPGDAVTNDAIGTKNGITLAKSSYVDTGNNPFESLVFGAWMTHGAFALLTLDAPEFEGISISARYAMATGELTGSPPSGSATWRGVMVGTPATGTRRGELLAGDATLRYDICIVCDNVPTIEATFDNIKNLDRLAAHTIETVSFNDIPLDERGAFEAGSTGNRIQGAFYGPDHTEAAGIFEKSNIVGAFGAKKGQ